MEKLHSGTMTIDAASNIELQQMIAANEEAKQRVIAFAASSQLDHAIAWQIVVDEYEAFFRGDRISDERYGRLLELSNQIR